MTVKLTDVHSLPICPSSGNLRGLPPSQQATTLNHISSTLFYALSLSDDKLSKLSCSDFISSYARGHANEVLNSLVFSVEDVAFERRPAAEKVIRRRVLSLASRLAALPKSGGLTLQIILDLCIVYGPKNSSSVKDMIGTAVKANPTILQDIQSGAAPSFASILLSPNSGLHALRKTVFSLKCLIQSSPPEVLDELVKMNDFVVALAKCYDTRLSAIASSYGGIDIDHIDEMDTATLWVGCKVALIDCFHALLEHVLKNVRSHPHAHAERAFDIVFALLNLPSASTSTPQTPFLNRPLIADYQDAYGLSATLTSVLSSANSDDARLDVLEATLKSFESDSTTGDRSGALKVILRSSGVPYGIDHRGTGGGNKGKGRAPEPIYDSLHAIDIDSDLDIAVSTVLSILPDHEPSYIRALLSSSQYSGEAERVIAALLEGDAPPPSSFASISEPESVENLMPPVVSAPLPERRNVFNEQPMATSDIIIGKRRGDADEALQDRAFLDQMKADILRRAAELSDSDHESEFDLDEELDAMEGRVKVVGDGEESDEDGDEDEGGVKEVRQTPETICELAYISNPKVFDRDADTRRSKVRADLKTQTGWSDEQLEGWRIMLERNPKKDKILLKHEFAGNSHGEMPVAGPSSGQPGRGRGRGRGGPGRGRGAGGSGGRGGGGGAGGDARERAWKDKNKARQGNHNRKRGHDKKMARGGAIPGPSG